MRILIAHSFYRLPGGEDRYVRQQVQLLQPDHSVQLLERRNEDLNGRLEATSRMLFSPLERDRVARVIHEFQPDVVHLHNAYPSLGPAVHLAAQKCNVPVVMTVHNYRLRCPNGYMFTEGATCRRCYNGAYANAVIHDCFAGRTQAAGYAASLWAHRFLMKLESKVSIFVAVSDFMKRELIAWGKPSERVVSVRNFTDHLPALKQEAPGEYGVYAGRISPEKGLVVLLEALEAAGDPPFMILGDGPSLEKLKSLAQSLSLKRTSFLGRVTTLEVKRVLSASRFVVIPSLWRETSCLAGIEGLTAGRPLLVSRIGALPELIQNGEGLAFDPGDVGDLANKIRILMKDDALCEQAGRLGLILARNEFAPEVHRRRLEEVYGRALSLQQADQLRRP